MFEEKEIPSDIFIRDQVVRGNAERNAINAPTRFCGRYNKNSNDKIHDRLKKDDYRSRMILQVHDELIFEVPDVSLKGLGDGYI
jgi:DNA polymerase-1